MTTTVDTADIAELLHVTREYVTDKLTKKPDFPPPVINRSRRMRRWALDAVERWASGQSLDAMSADEAR